MMTADQCRENAADCVTLGMTPNTSARRAAILQAMSRNWAMLANQIEQYEAIVKEEGDDPHEAAMATARSAGRS
jgi:hypothetical protein